MTIAIIAIPPELNIDLSHLEVLGLGRSTADKKRGWHQHRSGQRRGKSNLRHGLLLKGCKGFAPHSVSFKPRSHSDLGQLSQARCSSFLKLLEKVSKPRGQN